MVFTHTLKIRFLAIFVVAFICLNAGGAVCVAYCRTAEDASAGSEHCPLKKAARDCNRTETGGESPSVGGDQIDCCPMTVGFFAAPIEKSGFRFERATVVLSAKVQTLQSFDANVSATFPAINYRGPPFLDRRADRLKHRLLRI